MASGLEAPIRREIERLKKEIARKESEVASLNDELKRCERVHELLGGKEATGRARRAAGRTPPVNWDAILKALPKAFTLSDLAKTGRAGTKSKVYLRQIAVRWAKEGKTKRIERGKYEKVEQAVKRKGSVRERKRQRQAKARQVLKRS